MNIRTTVAGAALILVAAGCASRYSLPLYLDADNRRQKVDVEQTQYLLNARLGDPYNEQKTLPGKSTCLVLLTSVRGERYDPEGPNVLGFDENLKVRLFVELPATLKRDTVQLKARSFVHMLGRYFLQPEEKIFLPDNGTMVIDSLTKKFMYASLNARFVNTKGVPVRFDGQFRARIKP
jgi:hypothetical protein